VSDTEKCDGNDDGGGVASTSHHQTIFLDDKNQILTHAMSLSRHAMAVTIFGVGYSK